ncbi:hypothetical protein [uncultured Helicobacter sp.]|uniref:hypothetical protein n=1 Tax=uncultured Helicobacter sp. TaxID=175537 RepID=UPI00375090ED
MKDSKHIISFLKSQPEFAKLRLKDEINLFKAAYLTPYLREQILFIFVKNQTLFFAAKHPAFCQEFNYTRKHIIQTLRSYPQKFPTLSTLTEAKAYVPRHILEPKPLPHTESKRYFSEHSRGEFANHCTSPRLYELFEKLRLAILRNQTDKE